MTDTEKKPPPRVAVCIPSGDTWMANCAISVARMMAFSSPLAALMPINIPGADTVEARNAMTDVVLQHGAEWLLWIDADMVFPPDALQRLLAHDKDIVGVDYRKRAPPYDAAGGLGGPIPANATGVIERPMVPLGFTLVRRKVFEATNSLYFVRLWQMDLASPDNPRGFTTEDTAFCAMAQKNGFKVWCDIDLTREVSHLAVTPIPWIMPQGPR